MFRYVFVMFRIILMKRKIRKIQYILFYYFNENEKRKKKSNIQNNTVTDNILNFDFHYVCLKQKC